MADGGYSGFQINVKDPAGTLYNFTGSTVEELDAAIQAARQLPSFTAALVILDNEVAKAAGVALASPPAAVPPAAVAAPAVAAPVVDGASVVAQAAAAAQAATPPAVAPAAPVAKKAIKLKNPNAPRSEAQGKLISKLGGQDNPAYTMQQAVDYIDALKPAAS